jgi:hypothetical protein
MELNHQKTPHDSLMRKLKKSANGIFLKKRPRATAVLTRNVRREKAIDALREKRTLPAIPKITIAFLLILPVGLLGSSQKNATVRDLMIWDY